MNQNEIDALGRHIAENAEGSAFKKPTPTTDRDELLEKVINSCAITPWRPRAQALFFEQIAARIQADAATIAATAMHSAREVDGETVERVARALYLRVNSFDRWENVSADCRMEYMNDARAAIAAMGEGDVR